MNVLSVAAIATDRFWTSQAFYGLRANAWLPLLPPVVLLCQGNNHPPFWRAGHWGVRTP